jgi:site-specific DNA-methyltransferase (adenine-specific)
MRPQIVNGDCRAVLLGTFDMIIADPPYGDTSLQWDRRCAGWLQAAVPLLKPTGSLWVFGSLRMFIETGSEFATAGWRLAQDVVWEKHNGSAFHADRFKRVDEHVCHFYMAVSPWTFLYNEVQTTPDATARTVRRKQLPPHHLGARGPSDYLSEDGGPRIMRSVIYMRSMHGHAIHPTEKPSDLLEILIRTSCPPGGIVADLFAGSGAAGEAAARSGRNYIGCEIDTGMALRAANRLRQQLPFGSRVILP